MPAQSPSNPNFGTGYVDWGNYVNANQPSIQADRARVGEYLNTMDTQARGMQDNSIGAGANNDTNPYGTLSESLQTGQQALGSPTGFSQVLAAANANYDPVKGAAAASAPGAPQGAGAPPKAAYDPFSSALEGQNAQGLYNKADTLTPTPPTASPRAGTAPTVPGDQGPPSDTGREGPVTKPKYNPNRRKVDWSNLNG